MYSCLIPIYCFMANHVHLLAMPGHDQANTLDMIDKFKSLSGIWLFNHGFPRWQPGSWDEMVGSAEDWRAQARYIALNPVRVGLVENFNDYPYLGSLNGSVAGLFS
jgi:REP element-mobilizing transposase RayT